MQGWLPCPLRKKNRYWYLLNKLEPSKASLISTPVKKIMRWEIKSSIVWLFSWVRLGSIAELKQTQSMNSIEFKLTMPVDFAPERWKYEADLPWFCTLTVHLTRSFDDNKTPILFKHTFKRKVKSFVWPPCEDHQSLKNKILQNWA